MPVMCGLWLLLLLLFFAWLDELVAGGITTGLRSHTRAKGNVSKVESHGGVGPASSN